MPSLFEFDDTAYYREEAKRRAAWAAHYRQKGCNARKADDLARTKCRRKGTWPK